MHAFDCVPATEYVPAAQLTTTASAVALQAVVTRWPGPAVEQAVHVPPAHVNLADPPTQYAVLLQSAAAPPASSATARTRSASASAAILGARAGVERRRGPARARVQEAGPDEPGPARASAGARARPR